MSYEDDMKAVREDGYALKYVKDQTPELCLEAVREGGYALHYVKDPALKNKIKKGGLRC